MSSTGRTRRSSTSFFGTPVRSPRTRLTRHSSDIAEAYTETITPPPASFTAWMIMETGALPPAVRNACWRLCMPLDPQFRAILDTLENSGLVPLVRGDAEQTRAHYR